VEISLGRTFLTPQRPMKWPVLGTIILLACQSYNGLLLLYRDSFHWVGNAGCRLNGAEKIMTVGMMLPLQKDIQEKWERNGKIAYPPK
jgi:hypothetical protein